MVCSDQNLKNGVVQAWRAVEGKREVAALCSEMYVALMDHGPPLVPGKLTNLLVSVCYDVDVSE